MADQDEIFQKTLNDWNDQAKAVKDILIDTHKIVIEAHDAKKSFFKMSRILIGSILLAVSIVSVLSWTVKKQGDDIRFLQKDYVPLWVVNDLQENQNYMVMDIVAQLGGDKKKVEEVALKYTEFQKRVINKLAQTRGGTTTITRSIKSENPGSSGN
jgi:hypothetical protein